MPKKTLVTQVLFGRIQRTIWLCLFLAASILLNTFMGTQPKTEAATANTINFQARLLQSSGAVVPDGYYNAEFKLYNVSSGGSALWTETYYDSNGATAGNDNRVRVANGYLTVNLNALNNNWGSITDWDQEMWLTMNIGGVTQTATPTWDGEMSPRLKLTSVPYAFQSQSAAQLQENQGGNTGTLGFGTLTGDRNIDLPDEDGTICLQASSGCGFAAASGSANYIQNGTSAQTADFNITGDGTIGGALTANGVSLFKNAADSSNAFQIQNAGGATLLNVDTTNSTTITIGTGGTFSDDFESADMSNWTSTTSMATSADRSFSGNYSTKSQSTSFASFAQKTISSTPSLSLKARVSFVNDNSTDLDFLLVNNGTQNYTVYRTSSDYLCLFNGYTTASYCTDFYYDDVWYDVELRITAGLPGKMQLFVDGVLKLDEDVNTGSAQYSSISIGNPLGGRTGTIYLDDVSLYAGAAAPTTLNLNGNFNASATSTFTGQTLVKNSLTAGFQIQNSAGTSNLFIADTANSKIGIGAAPSADGATLQVTGGIQLLDTSTPAWSADLEGSIMYDSTAGKFYVYDGGSKKEICNQTDGSCGGNASTLQDAYDAGNEITTDSGRSIVFNLNGGTDTNFQVDLLDENNNFIVSSNSQNLLSVNSIGSVNIQGTEDDSAAFRIQNANGGSMFNVDTTNTKITLNGANVGTVSLWNTTNSTNLGTRFGHGAVVANGYVYVLSGSNGSLQNTVYYSKLNADGTTSTWNTTTSVPNARGWTSAVTANGYIYMIGGSSDTSGFTSTNDVYYAKINADGTLGNWVTNTSTGLGARHGHGAVVANGYVYVIAGYNNATPQTTVYSAKLNADGSIGNWSTTVSTGLSARGYTSASTANGYVYLTGGRDTGGTIQSTVYYSKLNTDGTVGSWTSTNGIPQARYELNTVVVNGYLYAMGGYNGGSKNDVYYTKINNNGTVNTWTQTYSLPDNREAPATVTANGYIYTIGGFNGSVQNTVYYTSVARTQIAGSLDLVGIGSDSFAEGESGGTLTAGNTNILGQLSVRGAATVGQGLAIGDTLTVGGSALFKNGLDSTTAFQIQNAVGTSILNVDTVKGLVTQNSTGVSYIGGSDAWGMANSDTGTGTFYDVTVSGRYGYVAKAGDATTCAGTYDNGIGCELQVYDMSVPGTPTYIGGADASGSTGSGTGSKDFKRVYVSGHYAYVTTNGSATACSQTAGSAIGCEFMIFDISNPSSPAYVGGADMSGSTNSGTTNKNAQKIFVSGQYAYVTGDNSTTACSQTAGSAVGCELQVYDVSNPAMPTYKSGVDASGTTNSGTGNATFNDVAVSGRYAYIVTGGSGGTCSATAGSAVGCELQVYDIANPLAPVYRGGGDTSGSSNSGTGTAIHWSLSVQGRYVYTTKEGSATDCSTSNKVGCETQIWSVSNPAAPTFTSGIDASGTTNSGTANSGTSSLFIAGQYMYVVKDASATACSQTAGSAIGCELQVYDVASPAAPVYKGGVDDTGNSTGTGSLGTQGVYVSGRHLYTARNGSSTACSATAGSAIGCELQVYDVSGFQISALLAGSIETGTIQVQSNATIGNNLGVAGSLTVGQGAQITGNIGVNGSALFQNATNSTSAFQIQNSGGTSVLNVDTASSILTVAAASSFQSSSTTALQVQSSTGAQLLNVDTTNSNILANGSFEGTSGTTGWAKYNGLETAFATSNASSYIGTQSLAVTTTAAANRGVKYSLTTTTLSSNTTYSLTFSARVKTGDAITATGFSAGRAENGSTDTDCSNVSGVTLTLDWTTYTCRFTTGTTSGTPYIYMKQNSNGTPLARTIYIDGVQLIKESMLANSSMEDALSSSNWQAKGSPSNHLLVTDTQYDGVSSLRLQTNGTADQGTKQNITLTDSTTYSLSFYAVTGSGTWSTLAAGYSSNGTTDNTSCLSSQTLDFNAGWSYFTCTFTTPASHSGTPYVYIKNSGATSNIMYIDTVRLTQGTTVSQVGSYHEGTIALNGVITSPATFQNLTNSSSAFQIQNASGSNIMRADTRSNSVFFGGATTSTLGAELTVRYAEVQSVLRVGDATNGFSFNDTGTGASGKLRLYGSARNTKKLVLTPEFAGAVLDGSGTGTMTAGYDGTQRTNYYKWTSTQGTSQTYDVVITMSVPSDWSAWATSNAISVTGWTSNTSNSTGALTVIGTSGATDVNATSITPGSTSTWTTTNANLTSASYTADGTMVIKLRMSAMSSSSFQLGNVTLTYLSQF